MVRLVFDASDRCWDAGRMTSAALERMILCVREIRDLISSARIRLQTIVDKTSETNKQ